MEARGIGELRSTLAAAACVHGKLRPCLGMLAEHTSAHVYLVLPHDLLPLYAEQVISIQVYTREFSQGTFSTEVSLEHPYVGPFAGVLC